MSEKIPNNSITAEQKKTEGSPTLKILTQEELADFEAAKERVIKDNRTGQKRILIGTVNRKGITYSFSNDEAA